MIDLSFNYPSTAGQEQLVQRYMASVVMGPSLALAIPRPYFGHPQDVDDIATGLFSTPLTGAQLAVTCSGQSALAAAIAMVSSRHGARIAADPWTFPQFIHALPIYGAAGVAVEMDDEGMIPDALIQACENDQIDAVYLMPNFHNPLGTVMPTGRREALAEIAQRYNLWVIEDEAYGFLEAGSRPSIRALVADRTLQIFSLSKMISLALRLGALVVPDSLATKAAESLRFTGSAAHPAATAAAARLVRDGHLTDLIVGKRSEGATRLALAQSILGADMTSTHPHSWHLWMKAPRGMAGSDFVERARAESQLTLSVGKAYRLEGRDDSMVRISFGGERDRTVLETGLRKVAEWY